MTPTQARAIGVLRADPGIIFSAHALPLAGPPELPPVALVPRQVVGNRVRMSEFAPCLSTSRFRAISQSVGPRG